LQERQTTGNPDWVTREREREAKKRTPRKMGGKGNHVSGQAQLLSGDPAVKGKSEKVKA